MIIVDTNVVSELMRPEPSRTVREWVRSQEADQLHTTAVTLAEILYGLERLPEGRRKENLLIVAAEIFVGFGERVHAFDTDAARSYARIVARRDSLGLPIDGFDAQIAAICRTRRATLATRNVRDFRETGIDIIDPWSA